MQLGVKGPRNEIKAEYNDAAKKLALSENVGASPEIEKEIHM